MAAAKYSSVQQVHLLTSDEPSSLHRSNEVNGRDSRPTKKAGRRNNRSISGALTIWWLESLLLLLMLATLAAICITTWRYQNKPVPKWPHNISVNTLNAVFGVILKTNIVVVVSAGLSQLKWTWYDKSRPLRDIEFWDQASRGPWGSLLLIWRLRGRHIIATIGALILILTLALDPFIQLLVLYNNCLTTRNDEQATVPIRHSYSESNGYYTTGWFVPTALGHAANAGILGAANTEIAATCQTGNCTFDEPYHTIAFCSQCQDISDSVSISCGSIASDLNTTVPECVVGVPGGFNNTIIDDDGGWETLTFSVQDDRHITGPNLILLANNLTDGPEVNPQKFQQCSGGETDDLWLCRGYGAANCSIVPCVQTFTARVDNGRLQESYRGAFTEMLLSDVGNTYSALNVKCLPSDIRDQLIQQLNYPIDATMEWIGYRGTDSNGSSYYWNQPYSTLSGFPSYTNNWTLGPLVTVPSECIYEMSTESSNPAQEYIAEIATGNVTTESAGHEFVGNVIPTALFNSGNISFDWINSSFA